VIRHRVLLLCSMALVVVVQSLAGETWSWEETTNVARFVRELYLNGEITPIHWNETSLARGVARDLNNDQRMDSIRMEIEGSLFVKYLYISTRSDIDSTAWTPFDTLGSLVGDEKPAPMVNLSSNYYFVEGPDARALLVEVAHDFSTKLDTKVIIHRFGKDLELISVAAFPVTRIPTDYADLDSLVSRTELWTMMNGSFYESQIIDAEAESWVAQDSSYYVYETSVGHTASYHLRIISTAEKEFRHIHKAELYRKVGADIIAAYCWYEADLTFMVDIWNLTQGLHLRTCAIPTMRAALSIELMDQ
jgi:hypothetical protein